MSYKSKQDAAACRERMYERNKNTVRVCVKHNVVKNKYGHCPQCKSEYGKQHESGYRNTLREKVMNAYGNKCTCCGENYPDFLTIDHVNGGGSKEREELGSARNVYIKIIKEGFPKEYRILCAGCNTAISKYNGDIEALRQSVEEWRSKRSK